MENIAFAINPADLQFNGYVPEEKTSNLPIILILIVLIVLAFIVTWYILKVQTSYELYYKADNLKK